MLGFEAGTCNGSDLYFQSPSEQARSMLFYMTSCGYYYTDKDLCKHQQKTHRMVCFIRCVMYLRLRVLQLLIYLALSTKRRSEV